MEKEHVGLWVRKEEKLSDGKGTRVAMGLERRKAVRWKRNTYGYGSGKKKSGPMEKEHVWQWVRKEKSGPMEKEHVCLWVWKEEKRSDGKGTCMAMGPVRGVAVRWAGRMGSNGNA
ncbi:hypothetical protein [Heyndrickxia sporothermodurans]|uniref:hypothetical protein n=1 Tax=Heyndrickxia sporothermodurans TaxID=46224 RepID=UPI00192B1D5F|nr:hypothetical protein [Heyndrickxia sporothermodurans]